MKPLLLVCALCLALVAPGCGADDSTSAQSQDDSPATTAEGGETTRSEVEPFDDRIEKKVVVGDYEGEGPFSAVHGGRGNETPRFVPPDRPAPKQVLTRDLEVGTGPAAQSGDEVSVYYAGAPYSADKPNYEGWPPSYPIVLTLGDSLYEDAWEESIEGMKAGGLRQAIIPSRLLSGSSPAPLNYVIKLVALETDPQPD